MSVLGKPIIHKEEYDRGIERELRAYLWEALYGPLITLLHDEGIETHVSDQEIGRTPEIKNASDWELFPDEVRSLRKKRDEMPQINSVQRRALAAWLERRSIGLETGYCFPTELRPSQEGFYPDKVQIAREHEGDNRAILVSREGFILDGHHQWWAAYQDAPGTRIKCVRYLASVDALLAAMKHFPTVRFKNARSGEEPVAAALRSNQIWYAGGRFSGRFNAAISKRLRAMGATWNPATKTFSLPLDKLPMNLRTAVAESEEKSREVHAGVTTILDDMQRNIGAAPTGLQFGKSVDNIASDLHKQLIRTVSALESISVPAVITPGMRAAITEGLTQNLALYITKFAQSEIPELRGLVEENAFAGGRTPQLARILEARWGIGKRKAKFLANQETSLLVSKYREETYKRIGSRKYMWSTAGDERVRPTRPGQTNNHRRLDGRIFSWDSPPVVDTATGRRCHPGQDFGCRCTAVPVLDLGGGVELKP